VFDRVGVAGFGRTSRAAIDDASRSVVARVNPRGRALVAPASYWPASPWPGVMPFLLAVPLWSTDGRDQLTISTILVIDDSLPDVMLLRYGLDQHGEDYKLEILRDGDEALQFVHEHRIGIREPKPCVIVLDLHLPRTQGTHILRAIREEPALLHIKVVVLAGIADPNEMAAIAALSGHYRQKPLTLTQYVEVAGEILAICKAPGVAAGS
jgi:CheY-like chemotaxis protein